MSISRSHRFRGLLAMLAIVGMVFGRSSEAQTPTEKVVECIDGAADKFVTCLNDLPWYAEVLCYAKYATDGAMCLPSTVFEAAK